ncbi:MAG: vitamin K epoxide reductase family protein [Acidimicrobiales bacterium]
MSSAGAGGPSAPPRWPAIAGLTVSLAGLAVAAYLTVAHYTTAVTLACPDTGVINCQKVTTSSYSEVAGVPVALLGLIFFTVMVPLQTPPAWRTQRPVIRAGRLGLAVGGMAMVLWLVYAELFRLDAICLYCSAVHVLTFALFVIVVVATTNAASES